MLAPIGIGILGLIALGTVRRAAARSALPVDVAATIRAALRTGNTGSIAAAIDAIKVKYPGQARVIKSAVDLAGDVTLPNDVKAAYWSSVMTGQPESLETASSSFESKYHYLSAALRDLADTLKSLKGVA